MCPNSDIIIRNVRLPLNCFGGNEASLISLLIIGVMILSKAFRSLYKDKMGLFAKCNMEAFWVRLDIWKRFLWDDYVPHLRSNLRVNYSPRGKVIRDMA